MITFCFASAYTEKRQLLRAAENLLEQSDTISLPWEREASISKALDNCSTRIIMQKVVLFLQKVLWTEVLYFKCTAHKA